MSSKALEQLERGDEMLMADGAGLNTVWEKFIELLKANRSLVQLSLEGNELGDDEITPLAEIIGNHPTLKILFLGNNSFTDSGAKLLANGIKKNGSLQTVRLSTNHVGTKGGDSLGEALIANTTLRTLELKDCQISTDGLVSIASALRLSHTLQDLNISENSLADPAMQEIGEALKVNVTLLQLHVGVKKDSKDRLSSDGAKHFIECVKSNGSLVRLDIANHLIGDENVVVLARIAMRHRSLIGLKIGNNGIKENGAKELALLKKAKPDLDLDVGDDIVLPDVSNVPLNLEQEDEEEKAKQKKKQNESKGGCCTVV